MAETSEMDAQSTDNNQKQATIPRKRRFRITLPIAIIISVWSVLIFGGIIWKFTPPPPPPTVVVTPPIVPPPTVVVNPPRPPWWIEMWDAVTGTVGPPIEKIPPLVAEGGKKVGPVVSWVGDKAKGGWEWAKNILGKDKKE